MSTPEPTRSWLFALCERLCRRLQAKQIGTLFERLQIALADRDERVGRYALECNNPQALRFLIDVYPTLERIFGTYPRLGSVRLLDIGPAFGASAGLLAEMHRSHFLGPKLQVDVVDIVSSRRDFIEMTYPLVRFIHSRVEDLPADMKWDVVYCSNVIEHLEDPHGFLSAILARTIGRVVLLAPYREEEPLSEGHCQRITESTFEGYEVESTEIIRTTAWPTTADGVERSQILVILRGRG